MFDLRRMARREGKARGAFAPDKSLPCVKGGGNERSELTEGLFQTQNKRREQAAALQHALAPRQPAMFAHRLL